MGGSEALRFDAVSQRFGSNVALQDVQLTVTTGELLAVVGPSGCGKSTLLRLAAGLLAPSVGTVFVNGAKVQGPSADVAFMFQTPTLLPWLNSLDNALLPVSLHRRPTAADVTEAERLLDLVGLAGSEYRYPAHLSGGMQQRVALARLLMTGADLLLLDEPFGALDEFTREKLNLELLGIKAATGKTIVLVTHSIAESVLLGDRVVTMSPHPGRIAKIVDVDLGQDRTPLVLRSQRFAETVNDVRDAFDAGRDAA